MRYKLQTWSVLRCLLKFKPGRNREQKGLLNAIQLWDELVILSYKREKKLHNVHEKLKYTCMTHQAKTASFPFSTHMHCPKTKHRGHVRSKQPVDDVRVYQTEWAARVQAHARRQRPRNGLRVRRRRTRGDPRVFSIRGHDLWVSDLQGNEIQNPGTRNEDLRALIHFPNWLRYFALQFLVLCSLVRMLRKRGAETCFQQGTTDPSILR